MRLKDKVCVITGGASGMGGAASRLFAREGAKVVVADVVESKGQETVSEIKAEGGNALFVKTDVSREADCKHLAAEAVREFGRLDVLYNNAGIFPADDASVIDNPESVWDKVLAVNLKGIVFCCKYAVPEMIKQGGGSVINIASFTALLGCTVPQDAYAASKGGVIALTKQMAVQFGPKKVRSNVICPGPIETPLLTQWLLTNPAERNKRLPRIPLGRFGQPEDVVYLALHLASDESAWTNGAVMVVDGGITSNYF
ncbi:MAG: short-chain dehydrogenase [Elusimicrobia bacterium RIFCSPLOWO2_01_FULL_59_12]|nr:MAG: short-chain dehydrogenase [Elusimicrobia bacterium RIFCSPLOWO2_01_FULL_59_12]